MKRAAIFSIVIMVCAATYTPQAQAWPTLSQAFSWGKAAISTVVTTLRDSLRWFHDSVVVEDVELKGTTSYQCLSLISPVLTLGRAIFTNPLRVPIIIVWHGTIPGGSCLLRKCLPKHKHQRVSAAFTAVTHLLHIGAYWADATQTFCSDVAGGLSIWTLRKLKITTPGSNFEGIVYFSFRFGADHGVEAWRRAQIPPFQDNQHFNQIIKEKKSIYTRKSPSATPSQPIVEIKKAPNYEDWDKNLDHLYALAESKNATFPATYKMLNGSLLLEDLEHPLNTKMNSKNSTLVIDLYKMIAAAYQENKKVAIWVGEEHDSNKCVVDLINILKIGMATGIKRFEMELTPEQLNYVNSLCEYAYAHGKLPNPNERNIPQAVTEYVWARVLGFTVEALENDVEPKDRIVIPEYGLSRNKINRSWWAHEFYGLLHYMNLIKASDNGICPAFGIYEKEMANNAYAKPGSFLAKIGLLHIGHIKNVLSILPDVKENWRTFFLSCSTATKESYSDRWNTLKNLFKQGAAGEECYERFTRYIKVGEFGASSDEVYQIGQVARNVYPLPREDL